MPVTVDFAQCVSSHPNRLAVADGWVSLTWKDLADCTDQARAWLAREGVGAGDRFVYAGEPDHRMVVWFWAVLIHGAVFVPLHHELNATQLRHAAADCGARIVVADAPGLAVPGARVLTADQGWRGVRSCVHAPRPARHNPRPDDLAMIIYTSGTTGRPRGVVCPHRQVQAASKAISVCLAYAADDVVLCRLPLAFDYGLYQLLLAARAGCAVVLSAATSDLKLLDVLTRHGVTVVPLVPSLAQMLIMVQRHRPTATRVRLFTNTGARLSRSLMSELLDRFPGAQYASMYGMTECKRISILPVQEYAAHPDSVGYAIPGDIVRIEDVVGRELAAGATGEIVVRGATVMAGYWGIDLADQSRYRLGADGLELHTGDRGFVDEDGRLYFVGRDDDIIKRHGVRMSLHEVEDAADSCPGVEAAVALKPESEDAPLVLAYTGPAEPAAVTTHLISRLDRVRRPSQVRGVPEIPLTRNGKPDRVALADQLQHTPTTEEVHHGAGRV